MTRVLRLNCKGSLLVVIVLSVLVIWYICEHLYDSCGGRSYTKALCEQFENGAAEGTLCGDLCRRNTVRLQSCIYNANGYRLFYYENFYLKVLESRFHSDPIRLDSIFAQPSTGVDVQEFRMMLKQFLDVKLGSGQHTELLEDLMDFADINQDSRVSLAEAKSIWALLKHNEFFMSVMLRHIQHIPPLGRFCGDMFAVQVVNHTPLYVRPSVGWFGGLTTAVRRWGQPTWRVRGKIAVGLLEFVSEIYHHRSNGMVYVCDASENMFGYSDSHDLMVTNLNALRPRHELELLVEKRQCSSDMDCRFLSDCVLRCDADSNSCTSDLVRPNLFRVCRLISEYLQPNVPRAIRADLYLLLERCNNLNTTLPHTEMDHALISNDLRSLLWRYVSDYVS